LAPAAAKPVFGSFAATSGTHEGRVMRKQQFLAAAGGGTALAAGYLARRCHHDLDAARARLAAVDRTVIMTEFGPVEYAERGSGEPLLVLHGILGGCDAGLVSAGGLFGGGLFSSRRLIAVSRFGYLGSSLPPGARPADQADAYAALLDALRIDRTGVLAISAGTTSALQFARRHPDRIKHLVVMSGTLPGFRTTARQAQLIRLIRSDLPMWALQTFAWPLAVRLAGVPKGYPLTTDDERVVAGVIGTTFPAGPRAKGATFDYFTAIPDVSGYDLEAIKVPTLIIHSKDDPLTPYDTARRAASRIPGARLVSAEQGGHLGLGQQEVTGRELAAFLGTPVPAERGAPPASRPDSA
jgi:pimeloyl-ACP methyl ester carboxylesterase